MGSAGPSSLWVRLGSLDVWKQKLNQAFALGRSRHLMVNPGRASAPRALLLNFSKDAWWWDSCLGRGLSLEEQQSCLELLRGHTGKQPRRLSFSCAAGHSHVPFCGGGECGRKPGPGEGHAAIKAICHLHLLEAGSDSGGHHSGISHIWANCLPCGCLEFTRWCFTVTVRHCPPSPRPLNKW